MVPEIIFIIFALFITLIVATMGKPPKVKELPGDDPEKPEPKIK